MLWGTMSKVWIDDVSGASLVHWHSYARTESQISVQSTEVQVWCLMKHLKWNIPRWKGHTAIIKAKLQLHTILLKNQIMCLRVLSEHILICSGLVLWPLPWETCSSILPPVGEEYFLNTQSNKSCSKTFGNSTTLCIKHWRILQEGNAFQFSVVTFVTYFLTKPFYLF